MKKIFFGVHFDNTNFKFCLEEKELMKSLSNLLNNNEHEKLRADEMEEISNNWKSYQTWYFSRSSEKEKKEPVVNVPPGSMNLLSKLMKIGGNNEHRPKYGYRYTDEVKRFAVYLRCLSGPIAYNTLQSNTFGLIPSISATNNFIYRPDNLIIEGQLRCDELLVYLKKRNQPMWVALSEDATCIENRVQYDSRTNQIIGFVFPIDKQTGMPQPFVYKARNGMEILKHFVNGSPVSNYLNTIMVKPIGSAPAFCLLLFGSNNKYTSTDASKRWLHVQMELNKIGTGVLTKCTDSDPKYNSAMRQNSSLGYNSIVFSGSDFFKCGVEIQPPFYVQDTPHLGDTQASQWSFENPSKSESIPFWTKILR